MITMADVAREAGVSIMTVSRVVTGSGYVKDVTRKKVLRVMKDLNYEPKRLSTSSINAETTTLVLIVPDITNPFFTFIARGMEDVARKNGYRVFIANTDENLRKESEYIDMCLSLNADGVLIVPVGDLSKENLGMLQKANIPFVLVDRQVKDVDADVVKGDIDSASYMLVKHLIDLGHHRIGIVTGSLSCDSSRERYSGYVKALQEFDYVFDEQLVVESVMTRNVDVRFIDKLLALEEPPTALFVANLFQYAHVYNALKERNLRIPEDMSIVTFGNSDTLAATDSIATCAIQPTYNFGSLGTQLLIERIEGNPDRTRKIILEANLQFRGSTAPPSPQYL